MKNKTGQAKAAGARKQKRVEKTVVWKDAEKCPLCGAINSLRTYSSQPLYSFRRRLRQCQRCGKVIEEREKND
jgi:hypothetical protein